MKNIYQMLMTGVLSVLALASCFKDKGNYDYHDINSFTVKLEPALSDTVTSTFWVYKTFGNDTNYQAFRAVVSQKLDADPTNIEYTWRVGTEETGFTENHDDSCRFVFYPRKDTIYNVRLIVRNRNTEVEYYKDFTIKTRPPYLYSWAVLHGDAGDRKIGTIEFNLEDNYTSLSRIQSDAYEAQYEQRRFMEAEHLAFASGQRGRDRLHVYAQDSCWTLYPYEMKVKRKVNQMYMMGYPGVKTLSANYGAPQGAQSSRVALIGADRRCYLSGSVGNTIRASLTHEADAVFALETVNNYIVLWNAEKKEFYYSQTYCWEFGEEEADSQIPDPQIFNISATAGDLKDYDLSNKSLLWIGKGMVAPADGREDYATAIMEDEESGKYSLLQLSFGYAKGDKSLAKGDDKEDENVGVVVESMNDDIAFDEHSQFATSDAFVNQLFYTYNGKLYVYLNSSDTKDIIELASFEQGFTPVAMKFRTSTMSNTGFPYPTNRILAIAFNTPDGKGEVHEYIFTTAGDIERIEKYTGFGEIVDMVYMYRTTTTA